MKCPYCRYNDDDYPFIEKVYKKKGPHTGEYCVNCGKWLRWVGKRPVRINTDNSDGLYERVNLIEPEPIDAFDVYVANNDEEAPF